MATRGHLGGLARATSDAALVLDASGRDVVLIETVGVGQDEIDIVRTADVSVVVLVPGTGDEVQALKAGIMEIADIFVVNKADREGADRTVAAVEAVLSLETFEPARMASAGVADGSDDGEGHRGAVGGDRAVPGRAVAPNWRNAARRARPSACASCSASDSFSTSRASGGVLKAGEMNAYVQRIAGRELDPHTAVDEIMTRAIPPPAQRRADRDECQSSIGWATPGSNARAASD